MMYRDMKRANIYMQTHQKNWTSGEDEPTGVGNHREKVRFNQRETSGEDKILKENTGRRRTQQNNWTSGEDEPTGEGNHREKVKFNQREKRREKTKFSKRTPGEGE